MVTYRGRFSLAVIVKMGEKIKSASRVLGLWSEGCSFKLGATVRITPCYACNGMLQYLPAMPAVVIPVP
jgi:hypothetical protein